MSSTRRVPWGVPSVRHSSVPSPRPWSAAKKIRSPASRKWRAYELPVEFRSPSEIVPSGVPSLTQGSKPVPPSAPK